MKTEKWIQSQAEFNARGSSAALRDHIHMAAVGAAILSTQPGATQCYPVGSCYGRDIDAQHWPFDESPAEVRKIAEKIKEETK